MRGVWVTVVVTVAALAALASCGAGSGGGSAPKVPEVVAGGASMWPSVSVSTPAATPSVELPADLRRAVAPLLATRAFDRPAPLAGYGLEHPQATLTYRGARGETAVVDLGQPNFDRHFVYAQLRGQATVYLLPADSLRSVLALVGIEIAPPG